MAVQHRRNERDLRPRAHLAWGERERGATLGSRRVNLATVPGTVRTLTR